MKGARSCADSTGRDVTGRAIEHDFVCKASPRLSHACSPQLICCPNATYCNTLNYVAKTASTFRIDDELLEGLRAVKERDGIPQSEQIRRAIAMWLESKSVIKAERKRGVTRRRS
jgi:hypothetical protein